MDIDTVNKSPQLLFNRLLPIGVALTWLALFSATFADLLNRWMQWDGSLAHGIPIVLIFLYLLWTSGHWQRETCLSPTLELWLSATVLLGSSALWFLAYAVNIQIIEQLLLLPILVLAYATVFGWRTVLQHRLLLLFLIFAIPIWGSFNGVLLDAASFVVGNMVRWVEMPALIQGNSIYIPYGHILIADGCSGLRYFVIALALAYMIGYLNGYDEGKLLLILSVAAVLGLITNWIRIFILIVIGYQSQMQSSLMAEHELFGWILFGVIFIPAIYFAPVVKQTAKTSPPSKTSITSVSIAATLAVMAAGPLLGLILQFTFHPASNQAADVGALEQTAPAVSLPVKLLAPDGGVASLQVLPGRIYQRRDIYHREQLSEKLVPYLPRLYDNQYWVNPVDQILAVGVYKVRYQELARKGDNERVAQLQWFNVGGNLVASSVLAKLWQVPATLKGDNYFVITTLQARCTNNDCERAKAGLIDQAREVMEKSPLP